MTYHNAVKYITAAPTKTGVSESLERTALLCARLGSPEKRLRYIRFAGSNGKTVCQTMLASILCESGKRVGSLLMPARTEPRENIIIGREILSMDSLVKYVSIIAETVNELRAELESARQTADETSEESAIFTPSMLSGKTSLSPTKNELIFIIALLAFRDANCDLCLIECDHNGVDPTKLLAPPHTAVICGTIPEENTKETHRIRSYLTSGITEVISAPQDSETYKIISSACARINCRLSVPTKHTVSRLAIGGSEFIYRGEKYKLGICGRFQIYNATTAIEVARSLNRAGENISQEAIVKGLSSVSIHSKFEALTVSPTIIVDSTHKTEAVGTMCSTLADFKGQIGESLCLCICPDTPLILEYISELNTLGFTVSELIIPIGDRASVFSELELEVICPITLASTPKAAAKKIVSSANEDTFVLVTATEDTSDKLRTEILRILNS